MSFTMPLPVRLRLAGTMLVANALMPGANLVPNHGLAAAMEIAGAACLTTAGVVAANGIVWAVIGVVEIMALVLIVMNLRLAFQT